MDPNYTETHGTVRQHEGQNITMSRRVKQRATLSILLKNGL